MGKALLHRSPYAPAAEIEKLIPDNYLAYLDSIGGQRDKWRWEIGDICIVLIDKHKFPTMEKHGRNGYQIRCRSCFVNHGMAGKVHDRRLEQANNPRQIAAGREDRRINT